MPAAIEQSAHRFRFSAPLVNSRSLSGRTVAPIALLSAMRHEYGEHLE